MICSPSLPLLKPAFLAGIALALLASAPRACAADSVDASPTVRVVRPAPAPAAPPPSIPPGAAQLQLKVGEVRVIHVSDRWGKQATAFYLPPEGVPYVQISFEKTLSKVTYFARGLRTGKTVGAIVNRSWLDSSGFSPDSVSDEVRVQDAVKASPVFISVLR
jgi:hypothetical protein